MIIVIYNQTGGAGKTTTATTLARLWAAQKPTLYDVDKFQQAVSMYETSLKKRGVQFAPFDREAAASDALAIVDCPDDLEKAVPALGIADAVIIPTAPNEKTIRMARSVAALLEKRGTPYRFLMTMFTASLPGHRAHRDAQRKEWGDAMITAIIPRHSAIETASDAQKTVIDHAPKSTPALQYAKAAEEIQQWLNELPSQK